MEDKQKIVEKLRKLFTLADPSRGGTEAEVMLAMQRAQEIMAKYNLSTADIKGKEGSDDSHEERVSFGEDICKSKASGFTTWEKWLASTVDVICVTSHFYRFGTSLIFIGTATDCAVAKALWNLFQKSILKQARSHLGGGYNASHRNYAEGFVMKLWERVNRKQSASDLHLTQEEAKIVALVVVGKKEALTQHIQSHYRFKKSKKRVANGSYESAAYSQGYTDGGKMNLSRDRLFKGGD
jgi:hypothetical protein